MNGKNSKYKAGDSSEKDGEGSKKTPETSKIQFEKNSGEIEGK